jgi:hypothetical protein
MQSNSPSLSTSPKGYIIGGIVILSILTIIGMIIYFTLGKNTGTVGGKSIKSSGIGSTNSIGPPGPPGPIGPSPFPADVVIKYGSQTMTPDANAYITVNFGYTFTAPPTVLITAQTSKEEYLFTAYVTDVTTTSFTYRFAFTIYGTPSNTYIATPNDRHRINWIAYGK